jgi:hypothetical protein
MQQITRFKWVPRPNARHEVFKVLQPAIRFAKDECLDLPDVMYQTRDIPLSAQVQKFYKQLKDQMMIEAAGTQISAVNAAAGLNKLLQISGGAVYTDEHEIIEFDVSPRLNALMEVIEETENKIIIFVPYRHTIELLARYLTDHNINNQVIQGSVSATQRASIINQFQSMDDPRVLVIQPQAASHGVTLTRADTWQHCGRRASFCSNSGHESVRYVGPSACGNHTCPVRAPAQGDDSGTSPSALCVQARITSVVGHHPRLHRPRLRL